MKKTGSQTHAEVLFERVVSILEQARINVVRTVNSNIVLAYWLIGREIAEEIQAGEERAAYGQKVLEKLSQQLMLKYGSGFSLPNLKNFRQFYQTYQDRLIGYPSGSELTPTLKGYSSGSELTKKESGFSPNLSWSHYRALMRVKDSGARKFYEQETIECGWSKNQLERQIHSSYRERRMIDEAFMNGGKNHENSV